MASGPRRADPEPEPERLQKALAAAGVGSRREVETWIRAGRVVVNGELATLGQRVTPRDELRIDGRAVRLPRQRAAAATTGLFVLHRSPGEALTDGLLERLPRRAGRRFTVISPMPRIDGGLEFATADGAVAQQVQRRIHSLESEFSARVRGTLEESQLQVARLGELDDGTRVEVLSIEPGDSDELASNRWYQLVVRGASGKQVRQLLERQGAVVSRMLRVAVGSVRLTRDLPRGRFRAATTPELTVLLGEGSDLLAVESAPPVAVAVAVPKPQAPSRGPRPRLKPGSRTRGPSRPAPRR